MPDTENYEILVIGSDRAAKFGVEVGQAATNMKGVQGRKTAMVDGLRQMHLERYRASGAELIMGEARFAAERTVEVELAGGHPGAGRRRRRSGSSRDVRARTRDITPLDDRGAVAGAGHRPGEIFAGFAQV